jgi:recombination protein RecA
MAARRPTKRTAGKKAPAKKAPAKKKSKAKSKPKEVSWEDKLQMAVDGDDESAIASSGGDILWSTPKYWISTRNVALDKRLGGKGLPGGRLVEVFGAESSGKSTFVDQCIAEVQSREGLAVLIDSEHARDRTYMDTLGVDKGVRCPHCPKPTEEEEQQRDKITTRWIGDGKRECKDCKKTFPGIKIPLVVAQVNYIEQVFDKLHYWCERGRDIAGDPNVPVVVVWDSVAGTPTREEYSAESLDDKFRASAAKVIKQGMRRACQFMARTGVTTIVTNQVYSGMSKAWGNDKVTYGGDGIRYHATIRIDLLVVGRLKPRGASKEDKVPPVGQLVSAMIVKNKIAAPMQRGRYAILFGHGVDNAYSIWYDNCGPEVKPPPNAFIHKSGSWYGLDSRFGDFASWQGAHWGLNDLVRAHPKLWKKITAAYAELP